MLFSVINYHPAHKHWAHPNYRRNSSEHILLPSALTSQGCSLRPGHDGQTASSRGTSCLRQSLLPKAWVWWCWDEGICRRRGSPPVHPVEPAPGPEGRVQWVVVVTWRRLPYQLNAGHCGASLSSQVDLRGSVCNAHHVYLLQTVNSWLRSS